MQKPNLYRLPLKYKNDLELYEHIIRIFSVVMLNDELENREGEALMFYFKHGYSSDTKDMIKSALGISEHYLNTINYNLDKKGYLRKDDRNKQKKHLSHELQKLKDAFVTGGVRHCVIQAVRVENEK